MVKLSYGATALSDDRRLTAIVYIPNSLFTQSTDPQVRLLVLAVRRRCRASVSGGGLETWWVRTNGPGTKVTMTPEPGSMLLSAQESRCWARA